ncbi:hypothetical protein CU019_1204 [Enterococcus faecium]|nr:hypothetical protein [Enterococcus faecium]MBK4786361.1 hypothetical protein [Enterococcus faecium]MBK4790283.1 hypothetical protein [Enterococcus faecium]MBK4798405.1 hypothetical protein [Enterococcus faecium]MBK4806077.1 hypothetical protein [Enterococcus faecium]
MLWIRQRQRVQQWHYLLLGSRKKNKLCLSAGKLLFKNGFS